MSESKLVIPTPKSCRQCKLSFKDRHQGGDVFLTCPYVKIGKTLGDSIAVYDKRHPQCPLQPIIPNAQALEALDILHNGIIEYKEDKYGAGLFNDEEKQLMDKLYKFLGGSIGEN